MKVLGILTVLHIALFVAGDPFTHRSTWPSTWSGTARGLSVKQKRDDNSRKCSAPVKFLPTRDIHQELGPSTSERNVTLLAGRMELPTGDMFDFYEEEMPEAAKIVWTMSENSEDMNTAVLKKYEKAVDPKTNKPAAYSCGTQGLCGCTTLVIISHKGVYATHWWEDISFSPADHWRKKVKNDDGTPGLESDDQIFQRTVLDPIRKGTTRRGYSTHDPLDPGIDDEHIKAFMVHPDPAAEDGKDYRARWKAIQTVVGDVIPRLKEEQRWVDIPYEALDNDDDRLFSTTAGKVLFKYDPAHQPPTDPNQPTQPQPKHKAALWVEGKKEPYHNEEWD